MAASRLEIAAAPGLLPGRNEGAGERRAAGGNNARVDVGAAAADIAIDPACGKFHGDVEIVSRTSRAESTATPMRKQNAAPAIGEGAAAARDRTRRPDRHAGLEHHRHFELYYAISGVGAVCHTINPRLFDEQIVYIVNHARDRLLFVDTTFVPLIERLRPQLPADCRIVLLGEAEAASRCWPAMTISSRPRAPISLGPNSTNGPPALCYTSGTTGKPKGALYAHRSTVLHAFALSMPDATAVSARDAVCPVVPMFHACAWGCPIPRDDRREAGNARAGLDGASLYELFETEGVTLSLGVPTIWLGFEAYLATNNLRCTSLNRILSGGSAVPPALIDAFENRHVSP